MDGMQARSIEEHSKFGKGKKDPTDDSETHFSDPEKPRGALRAVLLHPEPHCVRDAGVQTEGARVRARLPAGRLLPRQVHVRRRHRHRGHGTPGLQPGTVV